MTLVGGNAHLGRPRLTDARLTGIERGARAAVGARGAVGARRVGAGPARRIAGAHRVALIRGGAEDRARAEADSRLARIDLGAGVTVVARRAVGRVGVRALPRGEVAAPGDVTLIRGSADDRARAHTEPTLARVYLRARVAVAARRPVGGLRVRANPQHGVADAHETTGPLRGAQDRIGSYADALLAGVRLGAEVPVAAGRPGRGVRVAAQTRSAVAHPGQVARVERRADHGRRPDTDPGEARIHQGAWISVVAGGAVSGVRAGTAAIARVTGAREVTAVRRHADHRARSLALGRDADVRLGAIAPVVTGGPVRQTRIAASARARVAAPGCVAVVEGRADDGAPTSADARLTGIDLGAGVAVATVRPRGGMGLQAEPGARLAASRNVAGARGRAGDGRPQAHAALTHIELGAGIAVVAGFAVHRVDAARRAGATGGAGAAAVDPALRLVPDAVPAGGQIAHADGDVGDADSPAADVAARPRRAGLITARREHLRGGEIAHGDGQIRRVFARSVAELAGQTGPPALHRRRESGAGVALPRGDLERGTGEAGHGHGDCRAGARGRVAELAPRVVSPAEHLTRSEERAGVHTAHGDLGGRVDALRQHGRGAVHLDAIAELAIRVVAPALHRAAREQGTRVGGGARDRGIAASVDPRDGPGEADHGDSGRRGLIPCAELPREPSTPAAHGAARQDGAGMASSSGDPRHPCPRHGDALRRRRARRRPVS